ncbi:SET domain-containing protein [Ramicandelaber brevisporus]|nr:SET domain-containing protein [Ramicandelaber brevisporus]
MTVPSDQTPSAALTQWLTKNGVKINADAMKIVSTHDSTASLADDRNPGSVSDSSNCAFAFIATRDIEEEEVLATIPKDAVLSARSCAIGELIYTDLLPSTATTKTTVATSSDDEDNEGEEGEEGEEDGEEDLERMPSSRLILAVAVMYELAMGDASPWAGYFAGMPSRSGVDVPLRWSAHERDTWLAGTSLSNQSSLLSQMQNQYSSLIRPFLERHATQPGEPFYGLMDRLSFDDLLRAFSLVSSRSFGVDAYHMDAMVPLADVFNHRSGAENIHVESGEQNVCMVCGAPDGLCDHIHFYGDDSGQEEEGDEYSDDDGEEDEDGDWDEDDVNEDDGCEDEGEGEDEDEEDEEEDYESATLGEIQSKPFIPEIDDGDEPPMAVRIVDNYIDNSSSNRNNSGDEDEKDVLEIRVVRAVPAGEEVYNTYGYVPSATLLERYGFVEQDLENPDETIPVNVTAVVTKLLEVGPGLFETLQQQQQQNNSAEKPKIKIGRSVASTLAAKKKQLQQQQANKPVKFGPKEILDRAEKAFEAIANNPAVFARDEDEDDDISEDEEDDDEEDDVDYGDPEIFHVQNDGQPDVRLVAYLALVLMPDSKLFKKITSADPDEQSSQYLPALRTAASNWIASRHKQQQQQQQQQQQAHSAGKPTGPSIAPATAAAVTAVLQSVLGDILAALDASEPSVINSKPQQPLPSQPPPSSSASSDSGDLADRDAAFKVSLSRWERATAIRTIERRLLTNSLSFLSNGST